MPKFIISILPLSFADVHMISVGVSHSDLQIGRELQGCATYFCPGVSAVTHARITGAHSIEVPVLSVVILSYCI